MKTLVEILIVSLFTFSFCCEPEEMMYEEGNYKEGKLIVGNSQLQHKERII
jgi:hypothetical protein